MTQFRPWNQTVLYNIYPWTFKEDDEREPQRGNGSIKGMTQQVPYLAELGIDAIWVSPPYPGPMVDCGYDTTDITAIHPDLGTLEDMDEFIAKCHDNNIRVLMDFIPNHTSDQHEWFQKSRRREPGFEDWYIWHPGKKDENGKRVPPNNWASVFSQPNRQARDRGEMPWLKDDEWTPPISAWQWDDERGEFYLHTFLVEQPDLNWEEQEVRDAMKATMRFWLDRGVDGFRVDAIKHMGKNFDFPDEQINTAYNEEDFDNPYDQFLLHNSSEYPETMHAYVREMSSVAHEDAYRDREIRLILEAYSGESVLREINKIDPGVATTFNFGPFAMEWDAVRRKMQLDYYYENIPSEAVPNQVYGNHDNSRMASRFGDKDARAIAVLQLLAPGMAVLYSSEELGLHDGVVPKERQHDPAGYRDADRTPIVWDDSLPNAGFSKAEADALWLPVNEKDFSLSAVRQKSDPLSFYSLYKQAIKLRREIPAIREGKYVKITSDNDQVMAFGRDADGDYATILINCSSYPQTANLIGNDFTFGRSILSSIDVDQNPQEDINLNKEITLRPNEALVIVPSEMN